MKAWWLICLSFLCLSACATRDAPERTCGAHHECDANFLCAPEGICVPAMLCDADASCCPGADCFSGWCRPTDECDASRSCAGLGEVCEEGRCVPSMCDSEGKCPGLSECVAGRCIRGEPCQGQCGPGEACDLREQRCLPTAQPCVCERGWAVAEEVPLNPLSCSAVTCRCEALTTIAPPQPGVDGALVDLGEQLALFSYEPVYGDLVLSRFQPSVLAESNRGVLHDHHTQVLVGLPEETHHPVAAAGSFRDGIREPGPNLGERVRLVASVEGDEAKVDLLYRDRANNQLRYAHVVVTKEDHLLEVDLALPIHGLRPELPESGTLRAGGADLGLGRSQCLVRLPDHRLRGLAFIPADSTGSHSVLVKFESTPHPQHANDFSVTEILSQALPRRTEHPCDDQCQFGELCVAHALTGEARCAPVLSTFALGPAPEVCEGCQSRETCVELDGVWGCHPTIERLDAVDKMPPGEGLYLSCALDSQGELIAAWYDAEKGRLQAGRWPFDHSSRLTVDEQSGRDLGRFASIATREHEVAITYQDATSGGLRFARAPGVLGPYTTEEIPAEWGDYGPWSALEPFENGWVLATGEARQADIVLFVRRDEGCWGEVKALSVGGYAFADLIVKAGERAWVSARFLSYDAQLRAHHTPVIAKVPLPTCQP